MVGVSFELRGRQAEGEHRRCEPHPNNFILPPPPEDFNWGDSNVKTTVGTSCLAIICLSIREVTPEVPSELTSSASSLGARANEVSSVSMRKKHASSGSERSEGVSSGIRGGRLKTLRSNKHYQRPPPFDPSELATALARVSSSQGSGLRTNNHRITLGPWVTDKVLLGAENVFSR